MREIILAAAPSVTEKISYRMPSCECRGHRLVHFATAKSHVGDYGLVHVDGEVLPELAGYLDHRSTIRLPLDRPVPATALASALKRKVEAL